MTRRGLELTALCLAVTLWGGCGDDSAEVAPAELTAGGRIVAEAVERLPTALDLHDQVIARTCGPDGGVCHNGKEYPDLHTPGNLLDAIDKPCNVAELDPADIVDMCEPLAQTIELTDGPAAGQVRRLARHAIEEDRWVLTLDAPFEGCSAPYVSAFRILYGDGSGEVVLDIDNAILSVQCETAEAVVNGFASVDEDSQTAILGRVRGGDPNGNGVFGADLGGALVVPGDPEMSYLLQRMLGTVRGTRMPLANQPLNDAEYLGLYCWIETLADTDGGATMAIDYVGCTKAAEVLELDRLELPAVWSGP